MIKTRKDTELNIAGNGEHLVALTADQMELIGAFLGMVRLGSGSCYCEAAFDLIEIFEKINDDEEYTSYCLEAVKPILEVRGDDFEIIATYDDDHLFEFEL